MQDHANVEIIRGEFDDIDAVKRALSKGAELLVSFAGPAIPAKGTVSRWCA